MDGEGYWHKALRPLSRRRFVAGSAAAGSAAFLAACSSNNNKSKTATQAPTSGAAPATSAGTAAAAASRAAGTAAPAGGSPSAAAADVFTDPGAQPKRGGTVHMITATLPHFDIVLTSSSSLYFAVSPIYSRLLWYKFGNPWDPAARVIDQDLATSWENPSPTDYIFHIRNNATWHDGDPMNGRKLVADDIRYSYARQLDPNTKSPQRQYVAKIDKMDVPDDATLRLTMSKPEPDLLVYLASEGAPIQGREGIEKYGDLKQHFAGSGFMMFDGYDEGKQFRLKRNPKFYMDPKPYIDAATLDIFSDPAAQDAAFFAGNLDMTYSFGVSDKSMVDRWRQRRTDLRPIQTFKGPSTSELLASVKWAPSKDVRVRQALMAGLDRDTIIKTAYFGDGTVTGPVPAGYVQDALPEAELRSKYLGYDAKKAKDLLSAAGMSSLSAKLSYSNQLYGQSFITAGQLIQQQLSQIGMQVTIQELDYATNFAQLPSHDYELKWTPVSIYSTVGLQLQTLRSDNGSNWNGLGDPDLDAKIDAYGVEPDKGKRHDLGLQIQRDALDKAYVSTTHVQNWYTVIPKRIQGFYPNYAYGNMQLRDCWIAG